MLTNVTVVLFIVNDPDVRLLVSPTKNECNHCAKLRLGSQTIYVLRIKKAIKLDHKIDLVDHKVD